MRESLSAITGTVMDIVMCSAVTSLYREKPEQWTAYGSMMMCPRGLSSPSAHSATT